MDSDARLFVRCLVAAVAGFAAYRAFFPRSDGTPIVTVAVVVFLVLTGWAEYRDATRS